MFLQFQYPDLQLVISSSDVLLDISKPGKMKYISRNRFKYVKIFTLKSSTLNALLCVTFLYILIFLH